MTPEDDKPRSDLDRGLALLSALCPESLGARYLVISGNPASKARARFQRGGRVYASDEQVAAERALGWELKTRFEEPLDGNLAVVCIFFRANKQRVDVDNMLKHVMDSANKIAWHDDSQVTAQLGIIEFDAKRPRTVIVIGEHRSTMARTGKAEKKGLCLYCGNPFTTKQHHPPKFCSPACNSRSRGTDLSDGVSCAWCGKVFKRASAGQRFCSDACRLTSLQASNRAGRPPAACADCGGKLSKPGYKRCRSCWAKAPKRQAFQP
jgi:Holliday junction resolvase RusA-like endonuclease